MNATQNMDNAINELGTALCAVKSGYRKIALDCCALAVTFARRADSATAADMQLFSTLHDRIKVEAIKL